MTLGVDHLTREGVGGGGGGVVFTFTECIYIYIVVSNMELQSLKML